MCGARHRHQPRRSDHHGLEHVHHPAGPQTIAVSDVTPNVGETVGVGMPITVTFDRAVFNKDQCVNASPEFAAWFYGISQRGDVVTVTGTDRELAWNNGYGYWQLAWKQWLQGSTLKQPVTTTPAPGAWAPSTSHAPTHR